SADSLSETVGRMASYFPNASRNCPASNATSCALKVASKRSERTASTAAGQRRVTRMLGLVIETSVFILVLKDLEHEGFKENAAIRQRNPSRQKKPGHWPGFQIAIGR